MNASYPSRTRHLGLWHGALLLGLCIGPIIALGSESEADLARATLAGIPVRPSVTDPAIKTFNSPHYIYLDRRRIISPDPGMPPARQQLVLWLPGTSVDSDPTKQGRTADRFCNLAANLGYHVIALKYPNDVSATKCRNESDPQAFESFRLAIITGAPSPYLTIAPAESIENRLVKLLLHLKRTRPRERWQQFLNEDGTIKWSAIAVAGQSQGGGHAALIAIKHRVARVICTGAPKDYSQALHQPAAWLAEPPATPPTRFFTFNHQQDRQGCTPAQQLEILRRLGLEAFGGAVNVDQAIPPFRHTRILTTNFPGTTLESRVAHTTGIAGKNAAIFERVWTYMLTEPAD
jgi:pimeloyl-ACP methyl ester carboxylesterase